MRLTLSSVDAQRDVSVDLEKLGDVAVEAGYLRIRRVAFRDQGTTLSKQTAATLKVGVTILSVVLSNALYFR